MPPGASPGKREISLNQGKFEAMHKFILYSFVYEVFPVFSLREQYMHTLIHIMLRNFGRAVVLSLVYDYLPLILLLLVGALWICQENKIILIAFLEKILNGWD